ncbi:MAG TPA: hypothetical protein VHS33_06475 [Sphingomicrobium sp.]|jgi:hypothetical protein|nr:hypothetical protein [Sphingomicrobium sp.]
MSVDQLLPGEESLSRDRILARVPLAAFKRADRWPNEEALDRCFVLMMIEASRELRMKAGSVGLAVEAARLMIGTMKSEVADAYWRRDIIVHLHRSNIDRLAVELADEMMKRPSLRNRTMSMMKAMVELIVESGPWLNVSRQFAHYDTNETATGIMNRWLDHVEYLKSTDNYEYVVGLHRLLVTCLRVIDAVFGTDNLHVRRG